MTIKPVKKDKLSNLAYKEIKNQIIKGKWEQGTKIPSENELAKMLNVSRVTVRDSLRRLVTMGLLETINGEGTFVKKITSGIYLNSLIPFFALQKNDVLEILEFRQIIEVETAGLAAQKATEFNKMNLKKIYNEMVKNRDNIEKFKEYDLKFHIGIAEATKNNLVIQLMGLIRNILDVSIEDMVDLLGNKGGITYHKELLIAIENGDKDKSREVMFSHIQEAIDNIANKK